MLTFREVDLQDSSMILEWRTKPRVASKMLSDVSDEMAPHLQWMGSVYQSKTYYHWIIQSGEKDVGLVSVNAINRSKKQASWGFYIGDDDALGVGATVPAYVYNLLFNPKWDTEVITAEVLETNTDVLRMHKMYGYELTPEHNFETNGGTSVIAMCLTKSKWESANKFKNFVADFPTAKWQGKYFDG